MNETLLLSKKSDNTIKNGIYFIPEVVYVKRSRKGFTLAELIMGIAIMGFIIVIISGVFVHGLSAIKKGKYKSGAINIASSKLAELKKIPLQNVVIYRSAIKSAISDTPDVDNDLTWGASSVPVVIKGQQISNNIPYKYTMTVNEYTEDPNSHISNIKKVTLLVTWEEPGQGEKSLKTVTLVSKPARI